MKRAVRMREGTSILIEEEREYWHRRYWDEVEREEWEPDTLDALDRYLTPDSCFVDVGAWVGPLTLYAAKRCRWVYAVEPDPEARRRLLINLRLNEAQNVTVIECAVSDADGTAMLGNRHELGNAESSLNWPGLAHRVETARLSTIWSRYRIDACGLVKIDTEGGEGFILPDAAPLLRELRVPVHLSLHGEWVRPEQRAALRAALASMGADYDPKFRGGVVLQGRP